MNILATELAELLKLAGVEPVEQSIELAEPEVDVFDEPEASVFDEPEAEYVEIEDEECCEPVREESPRWDDYFDNDRESGNDIAEPSLKGTGKNGDVKRYSPEEIAQFNNDLEEDSIPGDDVDLQNGYGDAHMVDGDSYGRDNPESTTRRRDDNPIAVRIKEEAETKAIHESLVYKYREYKTVIKESAQDVKAIAIINKHFPEANAVPRSDFDGGENGIWFRQEGGRLPDGTPLYSEQTYPDTFGTHPKLEALLDKLEYYSEPYDAGTLMAHRK